MNAPTVSIIVPNFNHAAYLPQRLDSIFNQTFQDFEVILLDDHSPDNSMEILQHYAETYRNKVAYLITNDQNSGNPFVQWKKGIELAKGDFIWIAESDDFCEATLLTELYKALINKPEVVVAAVNLLQVNSEGKLLSNRTCYADAEFSGETALIKHFTSGTYLWNASAVLFRKNAAQNVDWEWITNYKFCGDWLFWAQLLQFGGLITLSAYLSYFRVHQKSVSSLEASRYRTFTEGLEIAKWIVSKYPLTFADRIKAYYAWWKKLKSNRLDKNSEKIFLVQIRALFQIPAPVLLERGFQFLQLRRKFRS
ncbi:MAG: glycosyltransferase [Saprospiraceae bacterium]|nr:glycosyltransferase [Saprospiraceae bacterium]